MAPRSLGGGCSGHLPTALAAISGSRSGVCASAPRSILAAATRGQARVNACTERGPRTWNPREGGCRVLLWVSDGVPPDSLEPPERMPFKEEFVPGQCPGGRRGLLADGGRCYVSLRSQRARPVLGCRAWRRRVYGDIEGRAYGGICSMGVSHPEPQSQASLAGHPDPKYWSSIC